MFSEDAAKRLSLCEAAAHAHGTSRQSQAQSLQLQQVGGQFETNQKMFAMLSLL